MSEWEPELLDAEILDIDGFDMSEFGFDVPGEDSDDEEQSGDDGYYGDERERTFSAYNLQQYDQARVAGQFDLPILAACSYVPKDLIGFNYVMSSADKSKGVHFFVDDYQFERIWNDPSTYIQKLMDYPCVLTPDFSLYTDMPLAMKIWNVYRSRLIGQMMQDYGINVIPTLQYAGSDTLDWCFEGIEGGGTVAVSTVGVMREKASREIWQAGMKRALEQIQPETVVCYGKEMMDFDFSPAKVVRINARRFVE